MLKKLREPVNGLTHLIAAIIAIIGMVALVSIAKDDLEKRVSLSIYGITLVLMFSSSAVYHLVSAGSKLTLFLRKFDHSAIYLLIAGSYTPICLHYFTGFWRTEFLAIIWSLGLIGVAMKLIVINTPRWLTAGVYLLMGWLSIAAIGEILSTLPSGALFWLVTGGLFFTGGSFIYIFKKPDPLPGIFGFHEIWHIFVILGAFSHLVIMLVYIAPP